MEGQEQAPPVAHRTQVMSAAQHGADLVNQLQRAFPLAGLAKQVDGGPDAGFQADRCATRSDGSDCGVDEWVIVPGLPCAREPEHSRCQVVMSWLLLFAGLVGKQIGQGCFGYLEGGVRIAEVFQAVYQLALYAGQVPAILEIAAYPVHCLPGNYLFHKPGLAVHAHFRRCNKHRLSQLMPLPGRENAYLLGEPGRGRVCQAD
jgi:hypothetical protein